MRCCENLGHVLLYNVFPLLVNNFLKQMEEKMNTVEVRNVSKKLGDNNIFENVSFNLEKGKIYGLVGATGSGKSTLLKIIMSLYKTKGRVLINGFDVRKNFSEALSKVSGIVDNVSLYDFLTAKENRRYFAYLQSAQLSIVRSAVVRFSYVVFFNSVQFSWINPSEHTRIGQRVSMLSTSGRLRVFSLCGGSPLV